MQYTLVQEGATLDNAQHVQGAIAQEAHRGAESFRENDPYGLGMTIIAMSVVLGALALLYLIFKGIGKLAVRHLSQEQKNFSATPLKGSAGDEGDIVAIAMALHDFAQEARDEEEGYVTIEPVSRSYSPWSSKAHAVMGSRLRR